MEQDDNSTNEPTVELCRWCKSPLNFGASTCVQCQRIQNGEPSDELCRWCKDPISRDATTCRQCQRIQHPVFARLKSFSVVEILGVLAAIAAAVIAVMQASNASSALDEINLVKADVSDTENRIIALTKSSLDVNVSRLNSLASRISSICSPMRDAEREQRGLTQAEHLGKLQCNADIADLYNDVNRNIKLTNEMSKHALTPEETEKYIKDSCWQLYLIGYNHYKNNRIIGRKSGEEIIIQMFGSDLTGCFKKYPDDTRNPTETTPKAPKTDLNFLSSSEPETLPVHTFYNPKTKSLFYTTSEAEVDAIQFDDSVGNSWKYEGANKFAYRSKTPKNVPVHRYFHRGAFDHFYTSKPSEQQTIMNEDLYPGWVYEGVAFYLPAIED